MQIFYFHKIKYLSLLVIIILTSCFALPLTGQAQHDDYPKLANNYYNWQLTETEIEQLAKWDIVTLNPIATQFTPDLLNKLRQYNPEIKILAYVPSSEMTHRQDLLKADNFWREINQETEQNNWWLKNTQGKPVSFWEGNYMINLTTGFNDYLPQIVNEKFLKSNQWDGVFYDNVWQHVSWVAENIDIDNDGQADSQDKINQQWAKGAENILLKTRQLAPNKIIVINTYNNYFNKYVNGRMQESFPAPNEGDWEGSINNYLNANIGYSPQYFMINANTNDVGSQDNYADFRFGLTSTLMGDGYYGFDFGPSAHHNLWWYDEYDYYLGQPVSEANDFINNNSTKVEASVWQRDFQNAKVLVNSTTAQQKIILDQEFEKIKGNQDTIVNNGAVVRTVTLNPQDGVILLRRIEDMVGTPYYNGSFVRVFDKYGESTRNGFFLYNKDFKGNNVIAKADINNDGKLEQIEANQKYIAIYNSQKVLLNKFYPYGEKYNQGINFALNDFENDGYLEIITGTMKGYAPLVKVFDYQGQEQGSGFNAYAPTYMGGVNVAVCDTNGNGQKEIVTGAGYMGGPQVRIFDKNGKVLSGGFFAYNETFRGGVNVACGDIDGNGIDEIVTGAGYGGSTHVRYFNSRLEPLSPGFWAFGKDSRSGVRVFVNDLNHDGKAEILSASPTTFTTSFE